MNVSSPILSQGATFALELAARSDGYLAPFDDAIAELRDAGLVTTRHVIGGFAIVKAVVQPSRRLQGHKWKSYPEAISP